MIPARLPENERERMAVLRAYEILDTPPERNIDELTQLASSLCGMPVALVTLIDGQRQWFKSAVGTDIVETERATSFCQYALLQEAVFEVPNALEDERFADSPFVRSGPKVQFYAGHPLMTSDGHALGTFCVLDVKPRKLTPEQYELLRVLSRQVMSQFELRRTLEQLARAHQNAMEFSELKDNFMRIASHDLKNPLTAMMGTAGLMQMMLKPGTVVDEATTKLPALIERSTIKMKAIIEDFLDFRAVSDGRLELKRLPVDLSALVEEIVEEQRDYAQTKQIEIKFQNDSASSSEEPAIIEADAGRLRQVITNLVGNAIKFSQDGTNITVRTKSEDASVIFEVQDEGPGLRDEDLVKLFTCYAKLSNKPTGGEHSSGIGLYICKQLIDAHGGKIGARNGDVKGGTGGAIFWFTIPREVRDEKIERDG